MMFEIIHRAIAGTGEKTPPLIPECPTTGCGWEQLVGREGLINNVIVFLIYIAVPLATAIIIYGGVLLLTAAGSEERIKQGKTAIYTAVTGLTIVFGSYIIYSTVIKAIFIPNS
ncbi:MAG: hypothetical protein HYW37_01595 [Candidatus Colwellbacteria bacterium]|nr:hypothetical protein [Candidatus Colwellbacteria bacterium]